MKTHRLALDRLHNATHYQLQRDFYDLVTDFGAENLGIETSFAEYLPHFEEEKTAFAVITKSQFTRQIAQTNTQRNSLVYGLSYAVKSALHHYEIEKQRAGKELFLILDHYGYIPQHSYASKTAAIGSLLRNMSEPETASYVKILSLDGWLKALAVKNREFQDLMNQRDTETANRTDLRMARVRIQVDKAFRNILNHLDALILVNGAEKYEDFVRQLNTRIDHYRHIISTEKGRRQAQKIRQKKKQEPKEESSMEATESLESKNYG